MSRSFEAKEGTWLYGLVHGVPCFSQSICPESIFEAVDHMGEAHLAPCHYRERANKERNER